jgi:hypothetical protein
MSVMVFTTTEQKWPTRPCYLRNIHRKMITEDLRHWKKECVFVERKGTMMILK